jgi:aminobenzoyl-glutamate utilization protein B
MVHAAKAMADVAAAAIADEGLRAAARAEHAERMAAAPYRCPLPAEATPPVGGA